MDERSVRQQRRAHVGLSAPSDPAAVRSFNPSLEVGDPQGNGQLAARDRLDIGEAGDASALMQGSPAYSPKIATHTTKQSRALEWSSSSPKQDRFGAA
jgi:hypothetical protein